MIHYSNTNFIMLHNLSLKDFQKWIGYVDVKSAPVHFYVQRESSFSTLSIPILFFSYFWEVTNHFLNFLKSRRRNESHLSFPDPWNEWTSPTLDYFISDIKFHLCFSGFKKSGRITQPSVVRKISKINFMCRVKTFPLASREIT